MYANFERQAGVTPFALSYFLLKKIVNIESSCGGL